MRIHNGNCVIRISNFRAKHDWTGHIPKLRPLFCRVPLREFSRSPEATRLVHLRRFAVQVPYIVNWYLFSSLTTPTSHPYGLDRLSSKRQYQVVVRKWRNINRLCIDSRLSSWLTPHRWPLWRKPWTCGVQDSHLHNSLLMPTFSLLSAPRKFTLPLRCKQNAPLPLILYKKAPIAIPWIAIGI